eukprot:s3978_g4.t1
MIPGHQFLRTVALLMVLIASNCLWILENPRQSLLVRHFRFEHLCNSIAYVYRGDFWMQLLGGACPKRTSIWSNCRALAGCLDLGRLSKEQREGKQLETTRRYQDGNGLRKWALDLSLSDRELFEKYPMQDLFLDGKLHECFFYVYSHEALNIPDSWMDTMATFHRELKVAVEQACQAKGEQPWIGSFPVPSTSLVHGASLLATNCVGPIDRIMDIEAEIAAAEASIARLQESLTGAEPAGTIDDLPAPPEPGDLLLAEGNGPQSGMVAGNAVKAPEGLIPRVTKTPSNDSLRAMPTLRYGPSSDSVEILGTPKVCPKNPRVDENGEEFQDAQSRHSSPGYSPSVVDDQFNPPPWEEEIEDDAESVAVGVKPKKAPSVSGPLVTPSPKGSKPENQHSVPKATEKKDKKKEDQKEEKKKEKKANKYDKYYHQIRRYVTPRENGRMLASKETVALFKTEEGRKRLREMLLKEGSVEAMDVKVTKMHKKSLDESKGGGWYTKQWLVDNRSWNKTMCDNAWKWAKEHNLWKRNPIHKEEEIKVVIDDEFKFNNHQEHGTEQSGQFQMEDPDATLLEDDPVPEGLKHLVPNVDGGEPEEHAVPHEPHGSFKLVFPTLQQNASVMSVLPTFLDTLSRKIEAAEREKEKQEQRGFDRATQYAKTIGDSVKSMNSLYDQLTALQGEAYTCKDGTAEHKAKLDEVSGKMKEITKSDIALNNVVVRAKNLKAPAKKPPQIPNRRLSPQKGWSG